MEWKFKKLGNSPGKNLRKREPIPKQPNSRITSNQACEFNEVYSFVQIAIIGLERALKNKKYEKKYVVKGTVDVELAIGRYIQANGKIGVCVAEIAGQYKAENVSRVKFSIAPVQKRKRSAHKIRNQERP